MRTVLAVLVTLVSTSARAERSSSGSGGALSHVSSGLSAASTSSKSSSSSSSSSSSDDCITPVYGESYEPVSTVPEPAGPSSPIRVTGYAGIQKVHDSNMSTTLELAVENRSARFGVQLTTFSEDQGTGTDLHLYMPSATLGFGLGGGAYLEGGVVGVVTRNDPTMDTSLIGGLAGLRVEHPIASHTMLVGTAQVMAFEASVRAVALSAGVRVGPLQASLRLVDFNVGPPLWGPEVGLAF